MPAIYHEGSWLGNATDPEVLVKDTVGWTGKNRLPELTDLSSASGVTFTKNGDGSITTNGSATARIQKNFASESNTRGLEKLIGKEVILSGCPVGGTNATYRLNAYFYDGTHQLSYNDVGEGIAFTFPDIKNTYTQWNIKLDINAGGSASVDVSGKVFYPMIRKADITDPTYEPYHESVEEEIEQIYADNGVLGAKNLLPNNATSQTIYGITYTVNSDGSVTANGTKDNTNNGLVILNRNTDNYSLPSGNYILSGNPGENGVLLLQATRNGSLVELARITDTTEKKIVQIESADILQCVLIVALGKTVSNLTFKPMLRLASDPDDTYQPYAMTNRELTEIVQGTVTSNFTWNGSIEKCGRTVMLNFSVATGTSSVAANTQLAAVPFKPKNNVFFFVRSNIDSSIRLAEMNTSGQIAINSALSNGGNLIGSVMYFS